MSMLSNFAQVLIALSIVIVWVFRFDNIVKEFETYKLSSRTRSLVGASKISLATLLVAGVWYPALVFPAALGMGLLMLCAQWTHFRVRSPFIKFVPSFILLVLSIFVASAHA